LVAVIGNSTRRVVGQVGFDLLQLRAELGERGRHRRAGHAKLQHERDQPLLSAIVQVPLDPPTRLVGGGDDPRA
jgi:hypothetical protein